MLNAIDYILDRVTMYRLVFYYLVGLLIIAIVLALFDMLPYSAVAILYTTAILTVTCVATNTIFSRLLKVPVNVESAYITAFILALIISPPQSGEYINVLGFLLLAGSAAMGSKYLVNIGKKHIFNPAALAVVITSFVITMSASWWVGTSSMLVFVIIGGILMVRKLRQFDLVISFLATVLIGILVLSGGQGGAWPQIAKAFTSSPLLFFAAVMLTEPLTEPPTRDGRIAYGILVGALFIPHVHFGSIHFAPELALLVGNVFAYLVSPKGRHVFTLKEIRKAGEGVYDFIFQSDKKFNFRPGQYMEWTLGHKSPDSRGNRRYLTIASSPTEKETLLGIKFYENPSTYKKHLLTLKPGDKLVGSQLAGDFVLPEDPKEKLVLVAGGIGVTPFRSMVKYLLDKNERRDIVVLYSNREADEIAYADILEEARQKLNIKTVYTITDKNAIAPGWHGYIGHFTAGTIAKEIPDFEHRTFYISGSHTMVTGFKKMLSSLGVKRSHIKTDFFPGLA